jgi:hypothetical protein
VIEHSVAGHSDKLGIHNHDREHGFGACASGRQLSTEGASRNDKSVNPPFIDDKEAGYGGQAG